MITTTVILNNGKKCPLVGLGLGGYRTGGPPQDQTVIELVKDAIDVGYRHFDTACNYKNEAAIGQAINEVIKDGKLNREDIFITTKMFSDHPLERGLERGRKQAMNYVKLSLEKLNLTYIDLMLIHSPSTDLKLNSETWSGLEDALDMGLVKTIGISQFDIEQVSSLLKTAKVIPAMNQIRSNPQKNQRQLLDYCNKYGIRLTAFSPLGEGKLISNPTLVEIGKKHNKSSAQVMIRWQIQRGVVSIPKSTKTDRLKENIDVFDFSLTDDEMNEIENMV